MDNINNAPFPAAFVYGADEKIINASYLEDVDVKKWKDRIFLLPAAGHFANIDQPRLFNDLLLQFAADVFT